MGIITATGLLDQIRIVIGADPAFGPMWLRLFCNNIQVGLPTVTADLVHCSAPGYGQKNLGGALWNVEQDDEGITASLTVQTFNFIGPGAPRQTLYGWYLVNSLNMRTFAASRFAVPHAVPVGNSAFDVLVKIRMTNCA